MLLAAGAAAFGADDLSARAQALRAELDAAKRGTLLEVQLARSGLESCERAIRLFTPAERESDCAEAQRRVDACGQRRDRWLRERDRFSVDALAAGRTDRHAALIVATPPPCPQTLPGRAEGPAEALALAVRREREALPGYSVCESYLRALLAAADAVDAALAERLAIDLVARCGADHPDYRRHAEAALIRVGREPTLLDRPARPAAAEAPASAASGQ